MALGVIEQHAAAAICSLFQAKALSTTHGLPLADNVNVQFVKS